MQGVALDRIDCDERIVGTVEGGDDGHGRADRMGCSRHLSRHIPQGDVQQIEFDLRLLFFGEFLDPARACKCQPANAIIPRLLGKGTF